MPYPTDIEIPDLLNMSNADLATYHDSTSSQMEVSTGARREWFRLAARCAYHKVLANKARSANDTAKAERHDAEVTETIRLIPKRMRPWHKEKENV